MNQTRIQSATETAVNYIVGYVLAWFIMHYVLHWFGYPVRKDQTSGIVLIFTVVSVIRSYLIRRFFNWFNATPIIVSEVENKYDPQYRE